ncbi:F-box/kelch-repeat protein At5g26960 [Lycium barbarum]|uniref:F-box/kelch-repeat protein At5g26960 n=1 Tax=Lycium barbarum TaxID=112863 RepID=UPI00293F4D05|nr:F-box/kelch-repeat protein At5g26960 [Lycium barbarum]
MSDSCNSRHFSWLMKSCFPNTQDPPPHQPTPTILTTTISSLPDELLLECLSRVTDSSLPSLPLVCSRWSHLLDSPTFHLLRHRNNLLQFTLFAFSISNGTLLTASYNVSSVIPRIGSEEGRLDADLTSNLGVRETVFDIPSASVRLNNTYNNNNPNVGEGRAYVGLIPILGGTEVVSDRYLARLNNNYNNNNIPSVIPRMGFGEGRETLSDRSSARLNNNYNNIPSLISRMGFGEGRETVFDRCSARLNNNSTWKICSFEQHGSLYSLFSHFRLSAIGRKIYVIGRTAMLRCDTWTGSVVPLQGPVFPRKKFAVAVVCGKIYVAGGCTAVEEYDPMSDTWRVVANAPRKRYGCVGASVDGVFYIIGGLKLSSASGNDLVARGTRASDAAHVYASSMDLYDAVNGVWLRSRSVPGGGCVVAACAAAGEIYILSSHAVELSFWKFNGSRKCTRFGEWCRIKSPPLPAQVRLDSTVRFSCVGIGETVMLVQVNGCIDDLLRRSGRIERGMKEGLVLVYDCVVGEWSRVADLPGVIRRSACVGVEC